MKLVRTLRGEGVLVALRSEIPVVYGIDIFDEGPRRTATGWIEGAFAAFTRIKAARLRLADGVEIGVGLDVQDPHGAVVEISDPPSMKAAWLSAAIPGERRVASGRRQVAT